MEGFNAFIREHRFFAMIGAVVVVAVAMTAISLTLYVSSGASSLDLSRPGYEQARTQVKEDTVSNSFPATGPLNQTEYERYKKLFEQQVKTISELGNYESAPISDAPLRLSDGVQSGE